MQRSDQSLKRDHIEQEANPGPVEKKRKLVVKEFDAQELIKLYHERTGDKFYELTHEGVRINGVLECLRDCPEAGEDLVTVAACVGDLDALKLLQDKGVLDLGSEKERSIQAYNAFVYAVLYDRVEIVRYFVEDIGMLASDILPKGCAQGDTPFSIAVSNGCLKLVKYLVETVGVSASQPFLEGHYKSRTPIYIAAAEGHLNIVKYLLEKGVSVSEALQDGDEEGCTPVYIASQGGHLDVVKYLIEKGASASEALQDGGGKGFMPIHAAALCGQREIVRYFAEVEGISVTGAVTKGAYQGMSPLGLAVMDGHLNVAQYLIEVAGVSVTDVLTEGRFKGYSPLDLAIYHDHLAMVKYLVEEQNCSLLSAIYEEELGFDSFLDGCLGVCGFAMHHYILNNVSKLQARLKYVLENGDISGEARNFVVAELKKCASVFNCFIEHYDVAFFAEDINVEVYDSAKKASVVYLFLLNSYLILALKESRYENLSNLIIGELRLIRDELRSIGRACYSLVLDLERARDLSAQENNLPLLPRELVPLMILKEFIQENNVPDFFSEDGLKDSAVFKHVMMKLEDRLDLLFSEMSGNIVDAIVCELTKEMQNKFPELDQVKMTQIQWMISGKFASNRNLMSLLESRSKRKRFIDTFVLSYEQNHGLLLKDFLDDVIAKLNAPMPIKRLGSAAGFFDSGVTVEPEFKKSKLDGGVPAFSKK